MNADSIFSKLRRSHTGAWIATYRDFTLESALQPIFSQDQDGILELQAFEGLIRPSINGEQVRPAQFFPEVAVEDQAMIDSLCRTLHIFNTGLLGRRKVSLFVNFHPGLFVTINDIRREVDKIRLAVREAGLTNDRLACEITQKQNDSSDMLSFFVRDLRQHGFRIAIDEYGAEERDAERLRLLKPDYVKFEATWVKDFLENSAGSALLRVMVEQFREQGVTAIFEGLEDLRQVDLCRELDVPLLQGYALARPQIAPTSFNEEFPEIGMDVSKYQPASNPTLEPYNPEIHMPRSGYTPLPASTNRRTAAFGKRTRT